MNNSIKFIRQYRIAECKNKRALPFDFAIFNENNSELICLIEYDGEQHFKPVRFIGMSVEDSLKAFETTKEKDNIKNDYCIVNNIKLIRIPYWDFKNVDQILKNEIPKKR